MTLPPPQPHTNPDLSEFNQPRKVTREWLLLLVDEVGRGEGEHKREKPRTKNGGNVNES